MASHLPQGSESRIRVCALAIPNIFRILRFIKAALYPFMHRIFSVSMHGFIADFTHYVVT